MKRRISVTAAIALAAAMLVPAAFPVTAAAADTSVNIAFQYGQAYAPLTIAKEQKLIEQAYEEATGKTVEVTWTQMSAGADINTGIASGSVQVGFMGLGPAITGCMSGVGYRIFTNLSGQEHGLMSNREELGSLEDLVNSDEQVALVNIGSFQHIILAKALDNAGFDAHALDANLIAMKHPDGMAALESGSVACHLTTNPYIYKERENMEESGLHEIEGIPDAWPVDNSFIVGVCSAELCEENPDLYEAVCQACADAIDYINEHGEDAAKITCEFNGTTPEEELKYLEAGTYSTETRGVFELATFMAEHDFLDNAPESFADLAYENVKGN